MYYNIIYMCIYIYNYCIPAKECRIRNVLIFPRLYSLYKMWVHRIILFLLLYALSRVSNQCACAGNTDSIFGRVAGPGIRMLNWTIVIPFIRRPGNGCTKIDRQMNEMPSTGKILLIIIMSSLSIMAKSARTCSVRCKQNGRECDGTRPVPNRIEKSMTFGTHQCYNRWNMFFTRFSGQRIGYNL